MFVIAYEGFQAKMSVRFMGKEIFFRSQCMQISGKEKKKLCGGYFNKLKDLALIRILLENEERIERWNGSTTLSLHDHSLLTVDFLWCPSHRPTTKRRHCSGGKRVSACNSVHYLQFFSCM